MRSGAFQIATPGFDRSLLQPIADLTIWNAPMISSLNSLIEYTFKSVAGILYQIRIYIDLALREWEQVIFSRIEFTWYTTRVGKRRYISFSQLPAFDVTVPQPFQREFNPSLVPNSRPHFQPAIIRQGLAAY